MKSKIPLAAAGLIACAGLMATALTASAAPGSNTEPSATVLGASCASTQEMGAAQLPPGLGQIAESLGDEDKFRPGETKTLNGVSDRSFKVPEAPGAKSSACNVVLRLAGMPSSSALNVPQVASKAEGVKSDREDCLVSLGVDRKIAAAPEVHISDLSAEAVHLDVPTDGSPYLGDLRDLEVQVDTNLANRAVQAEKKLAQSVNACGG